VAGGGGAQYMTLNTKRLIAAALLGHVGVIYFEDEQKVPG
jgi:hypothetical protein